MTSPLSKFTLAKNKHFLFGFVCSIIFMQAHAETRVSEKHPIKMAATLTEKLKLDTGSISSLSKALPTLEVSTSMLELHGIGKTKDVNTTTLELHGVTLGPREVNTASLELHGIVGAGNSAGASKEVSTGTLELHGLSKATKDVNVAGTLELHGKSKTTETSVSQKRIGMSAPPVMQGATGAASNNSAINTLPANIAPRDKPIDPNIIKQNNVPDTKVMANQTPIGINRGAVIANNLPEIKSIMPAPAAAPNPAIVQNTLPTNTFDKLAYKRDANNKLGNLWLSKCSSIDCKRAMQSLIDARIAEVLDKADKAVDLRNPVLLNNLENQMDAKYNPQMQQVLDKDKPVIRGMPKPIKINPNNLKLN